MKFSQKIFLLSFTLLIIVVHIIGILMINYTYKTNLDKEIEKNLLQINNIIRTVQSNITDLSNIANTYLKNKVNIEIYIGGRKTYTNFKDEDSKIGEKLYIPEVVVEEYDKTKLINMSEKVVDQYKQEKSPIKLYIKDDKLFMKIQENNNVVLTLSNISEINNMKKEQTEFFIKISFIISFFIAFLLSITVNLLTRKIKLLNKTVEQIEKGDYSTKVKKLGNDEIGKFGESFNNMTEAIQKNVSKIEEVSENRKKFIGNLTHEIKTPLTSIIGYSSLIKNRKVNDKEIIIEYANKIYEEGKYIEKMSEKLMEILLLGKGQIEMEDINLSNELNKIINQLKEIFPYVEYEQEIEKNIKVKVDKTLLKSLIFNLVKNAINAYEEKPLIIFKLNKEKQIKIIDHGKGIAKEELEKIKEPFYTINKDRNRNLSGMGLGIPLCIKIVEILNGKLEMQSEENVGTTITISLGEENEK